MLIILSIRFLFLCVLLIQTQKVVFAVDNFGAKYKKTRKLKSKHVLIWILMVALESFLSKILFLAGIYAKVTIF